MISIYYSHFLLTANKRNVIYAYFTIFKTDFDVNDKQKMLT